MRVRSIVLAGGFVLLAVLFAQLGPDLILSLLSTLGANFIVIALLFCSHECVRALAIRHCFAGEDPPVFLRVLRVRFLGELAGSLTRTGSFAAEPTRAWLLAGKNGAGIHAYAATIGELVANSCVSSLVTAVVVAAVMVMSELHGGLLILSHVLLWSSLVYVLAAIAAVTTRARLVSTIGGWLLKMSTIRRRTRVDISHLRQVDAAIVLALTQSGSVLTRVLLLECLAQVILGLEIYWTIHSMDVPITAGRALVIEVMARAVNLVPLVGVNEAGYAVLFEWLSMSAAVGFTLSLVKLLRSITVATVGLGVLNQLDRYALAAAPVPPWPAQDDSVNRGTA